jgi:hypothetical protein
MQPKLSKGYSKYGADEGRSSTGLDESPPIIRFYLRDILTGDDGAYDEEGAYWGMGNPVYWAYCDDHEGQEVINRFFRAKNRTEAKEICRKMYPNSVVKFRR